jgi:hypothetical protein
MQVTQTEKKRRRGSHLLYPRMVPRT